jgi:hypothetical protein
LGYQMAADTTADGSLHLGKFDIEPCRFDRSARRLDGLPGLALVGGPCVHFFLRDGAGFDQLLGPSEVLLRTLMPGHSLL